MHSWQTLSDNNGEEPRTQERASWETFALFWTSFKDLSLSYNDWGYLVNDKVSLSSLIQVLEQQPS